MRLSKDITRLIATMIGALAGAGLGIFAMLKTFRYYEDTATVGGALPVVIAALFIGGGLIGGGYLLLWLHMKWEKIAPGRNKGGRKKYEPDKKKKKK